MKKKINYFLFAAITVFISACNGLDIKQAKKSEKHVPANYANYNIQVGTYHTKKGVKMADFKKIDSLMEQVYTSKQPGFISRESGIDQKGNWLVVVSYDTEANANAAYERFKTNPLAADFRNNIDTASLSLQNFLVKDDHSVSLKDKKPFVIEVATFREMPGVNLDTFEKRDMEIEKDYMSAQDGYITRKIGVSHNGGRLMMIYWKTLEDADNGMKEFMKDKSVADYSKMIDWPTVKLQRFNAVY